VRVRMCIADAAAATVSVRGPIKAAAFLPRAVGLRRVQVLGATVLMVRVRVGVVCRRHGLGTRAPMPTGRVSLGARRIVEVPMRLRVARVSCRCTYALERASAVPMAGGGSSSVGRTAVPAVVLLLLQVLLQVLVVMMRLLSTSAVPETVPVTVPVATLAAPQLPLAVLQVRCVARASGRRRAEVIIMQ